MQTTRAACCNNAGRHEEGEVWARKAMNARSNQVWPYLTVAHALVGQGRLDEARAAINVARDLKADLTLSSVRGLTPHFHPDYLEHYVAALGAGGLPE